MKHILLLCLFAVSCSKSEKPDINRHSADVSLLNKKTADTLTDISRWNKNAENKLDNILKNEDQMIRLLALKRISGWKIEHSINFYERFMKDPSGLIQRKTFEALWGSINEDSPYYEKLLDISLSTLSALDEKLFKNSVLKVRKKLGEKRRLQLIEIIKKSPPKRLPELFDLLCSHKLSKVEANFIVDNEKKLGFSMSSCQKAIKSALKNKFKNPEDHGEGR
ncbi:MAG: hypothetical protein JXR95_00855 [Deltaproteobacteria bacterium]|nr:hypothetical protein [Deltaproteobacteria bacterium]